MRQEIRALGAGLLGIAAACGSTSNQAPTAAAACGGLDATSGSASIGAAASGGTTSAGTTNGGATTAGSPGSLPEPDPTGGVAGDGSGAGGGTSSAGAGGEGGDPDAGKTLISGVVVGDDESPVAGAVVLAQGRRVATDADGSFQLHVTVPYDLALLEPPLDPADQPSIGEPHGYLGLTSTRIKLYVRTLLKRTTKISGLISRPLAAPEPMLGLVYGHSKKSVRDAAIQAGGPFSSVQYSLSAPPWHGDRPLRAMLIVAQADPAPDGVAPHLNSLATKAILLDSNMNLGSPATDVMLKTPTFHSLALTWQPPAGQGFDDCDITVELGGAFQFFFQHACAPISHNIDIPDGLPEGVILVSANAYSSAQNWEYAATAVVPSTATTFSVAVPQSLPVIQGPADQASLKASTGALSYAPIANALADVELCFPNWKAKRNDCADIYTSEPVVPLSRILSLGLATAASGSMTFELKAVPNLQTTDELVAPSFFKADATWQYRDYSVVAARRFSYSAD